MRNLDRVKLTEFCKVAFFCRMKKRVEFNYTS